MHLKESEVPIETSDTQFWALCCLSYLLNGICLALSMRTLNFILTLAPLQLAVAGFGAGLTWAAAIVRWL